MGPFDTSTFAGRSRVRVVVIDDDEAVRTLALRILRHHGFVAVGASGVEDGADMVRRTRPHVVIVDRYLGLDCGRAFLERMKPALETELGGGAPAWVLCTGGEEGGADVLPKPFMPHELVAAVTTRVAHAGRL